MQYFSRISAENVGSQPYFSRIFTDHFFPAIQNFKKIWLGGLCPTTSTCGTKVEIFIMIGLAKEAINFMKKFS